MDAANPLEFDKLDRVAQIQVALQFVDSGAKRSIYWGGALTAAAVPLITVTTNPNYPFTDALPRDFQPRVANAGSALPLEEVLKEEFSLYEQNFLEAQDEKTIERYTMQVAAAASAGRYETGTRTQYVEIVMGDKYDNINQPGVFAPRGHVHDITIMQTWNAIEKKVDLSQLADELRQLREELQRKAASSEQKDAASTINAIAEAEKSARQKDGPTMIQHLKTAGRWAFTVSEGLHLAHIAIAFKSGLGFG
jgi:hypothetical protein